MSFDFNIRSQSARLIKLCLVIASTMVLASCVTPRTTNSFGTSVSGAHPNIFNCRAKPDLQLSIVQNATGDAIKILCPNDLDDCTEPTQESGRASVKQSQTVRWKLANGNTTQFYIIFDEDKSPAHANNSRGTSIVGSEGGFVCLKVHARAVRSDDGFPYDYSVFVKHCAGEDNCTPRVLDPIIYVR